MFYCTVCDVDGSKQKTLLLQLYILYCVHNKAEKCYIRGARNMSLETHMHIILSWTFRAL